MTGIGIDTLRAWERRYGAVTPVRDDRGRMYTEADVARLRLLNGAVEQGHSIGRLAGLSNDQLRDLCGAAGAVAVPAADPARRTPLDTTALITALREYDAVGIDQELSRLAAVLRPLELLQDVLMPVLTQVGDDWHRRRTRIAHEHLMSSTMRNLLGAFLRLYARREASVRLLFATPSGERHEIATLGAAMLAASAGLGVSYLGADLPAREIVDSVEPAGAQVLVLGLTTAAADKARERELKTIVRELPEGVELWAGGRGAERHASIIRPRGVDPFRLQRLPAGTCPHRRTRGVTPVTRRTFAFRPSVSSALAAVMLTLRLHACGCTGHHRRGRHQRRGRERRRPAGRGSARVRPRHLLLRHQRRPRRVSHRRAARGKVSAGDSAPRRPALHQRPVDVRAGLDGTVEITLPTVEDFQQTVTVTAPEFRAPEAVKNSGFLVAPREILKSAAALQDVSRYVQGLPGVVIGTNDFRNDIIVRGGSPLENLFVVDNVEIPNINAFANFASAGGTVSLLDAELLQDVTFLTGGYPAPFINRTSSVLQVTQREGSRKEFGGWATLGFAGAGAILEGPIDAGTGTGKGSWVVSARRSFLDLFTEDVGFGGVPVVYALNAKAVYDLTPRDRIWLVNIAGVDEIRLGLTESTDLEEEIANFDIRYDGWRSATGFNWQRTFGSRGVGLLGISHSQAKVGQQVKDLVAQGVPPPGCAARSRHRAESRRLPRGLARGGDHRQVRPHRCTCRCSTRCRPAAASRRSASTTRWSRPTATTRRTRRWPASTRSISTRSSARTSPAPTCRPRNRWRRASTSRWAGASTTTPSCRRRGSARARASTCALPTRCRGTRARVVPISSPRSSS